VGVSTAGSKAILLKSALRPPTLLEYEPRKKSNSTYSLFFFVSLVG
jgi:hypothetical protein